VAYASGAFAQWPERQVRFIVPGSAGSAPDIMARVVAEKLSTLWGGRPVVVDPKPGGNTVIGVEAAAKAAPDGYTFLFTQAAPLTISPYTMKNVPYNVETDFDPIVYIGYTPMMIAVHPSVPATNLKELVSLAKTRPGELNYGTSSTRNVPHLTGELLKSVAGIKLTHVPYKGSAQAVQDAIGGQVQVVIDGASPLVMPTRSGRLRPIAVTSLKRFPSLPELPTVAEVYPGFEVTGWFAIMAPARTPANIVERVNRDANAVLAMSEVVARLGKFGVIPVGGTVDELKTILKRERENYARIVREARIEAE
jgi:tripartite-type tricarboxylate transporter receptor subunit TctC